MEYNYERNLKISYLVKKALLTPLNPANASMLVQPEEKNLFL